MVVYADSAPHLVVALEQINGEANGISAPAEAEGTIASGAVSGLNELPLPPHMKLLKQIVCVSFDKGEYDGEDFNHVVVTMTDPTVANQLKSIIEGLQAMGQLHFSDHPDVVKIIDGLKVKADGSVLKIDWKGSVDDVNKFIDKAIEFIRKHHK